MLQTYRSCGMKPGQLFHVVYEEDDSDTNWSLRDQVKKDFKLSKNFSFFQLVFTPEMEELKSDANYRKISSETLFYASRPKNCYNLRLLCQGTLDPLYDVFKGKVKVYAGIFFAAIKKYHDLSEFDFRKYGRAAVLSFPKGSKEKVMKYLKKSDTYTLAIWFNDEDRLYITSRFKPEKTIKEGKTYAEWKWK